MKCKNKECPYEEDGECEKSIHYDDPSDCEIYRDSLVDKPITNADRIRALSDDELEKEIKLIAEKMEINDEYGGYWKFNLKDWLRQEVEHDD